MTFDPEVQGHILLLMGDCVGVPMAFKIFFLFNFFSSCDNITRDNIMFKILFISIQYISIITTHNCSMNRGKVASIKSLLTPLDQSQVWQFMAT